MDGPPVESPIVEYERSLALRGDRARKLIYACYGVTLVPYVASWFAGLWPGAAPWMFFAAFGLAYLCGLATGAVTLWNWSLLSWQNRLLGLAPWFYFSLMAFPFAVKELRSML